MNAYAFYVIGILVLIFGAIGFIRGWRREVVALAGSVVGWGLALLGGRYLVLVVDQAYLIAAATFQGLFVSNNPGDLLQRLRAHPLVDPASPEPLYAIVFALAVVAAYSLGSRYAPAVTGPGAQLLGLPVGLLNGYLLSAALLQYAAPSGFGRQLAATTNLVTRYLTPGLAAGAVVVLAALILAWRGRAARPAKAAKGGRSSRARARG